MPTRQDARSLWDSMDGRFFSLDDPDASSDAAVRPGIAVQSAGASQNATASAAGPAADGPVDASIQDDTSLALSNWTSSGYSNGSRENGFGTLSARHQELLEEKVRQLKQKERSVGRRKARRQENTRMASNPHVAKPTMADYRIPHSSNPVSSTFTAPIPEELRIPGEGHLLDHVRPEKPATSSTSAALGKYSLSLRDARRILDERASLAYKHLPPTREAWRADPMQEAAAARPSSRSVPLDIIDEVEDDAEGGADAAQRNPDHGPLQRVLIKAAREIAEWTDSLVVDVKLPKPAESVTDLRAAAVEQLQASSSAAQRQSANSASRPLGEEGAIDADPDAGADITITPETYDAEPSLELEPDGFWVEVERTQAYMCWIVEDAFDRLMLHCLARIYGCSSFSCNERWKRYIGQPPAPAGANRAGDHREGMWHQKREKEESIRCTYIVNPRRGTGARNKLLAAGWNPNKPGSRSKRRKRKGSIASSSGDTSAAGYGDGYRYGDRSSSVDTGFDTDLSVDGYSISDFDTAASESFDIA
ncbi:hypothetical protein K437DRAFT_269570 [Tilletiaria anomala UBC 951]|uniref:Uncharacterized protein n=1 Tax=Tilletiaria anomala (strain ATCC 24038 / CBS 436.72 / UBC 951) TaxID=1037660 RepID=A0A066VTL7_TILAU|nr:uncharacterized protein K437DRAFT_269570 [Tilletiaria anomala UBC 951]KDN41885.1 hypothetical protein K437DRAFT_269570 [Tilletiaria anomala UBC 951]